MLLICVHFTFYFIQFKRELYTIVRVTRITLINFILFKFACLYYQNLYLNKIDFIITNNSLVDNTYDLSGKMTCRRNIIIVH